MATAKRKQISSVVVSQNLAAIAAANPGLKLSAQQLADINAGVLVLAPAPGPGGGSQPVPKGCLTYLRFGDSDQDLDFIQLDGVTYSGPNIRRFRDTLLKAACCRICINFCWNHETRQLTMLNLYPCSECRPNERCGCGDN